MMEIAVTVAADALVVSNRRRFTAERSETLISASVCDKKTPLLVMDDGLMTGTTRQLVRSVAMSALPLKADIKHPDWNVR
jgi:hypothetical protein